VRGRAAARQSRANGNAGCVHHGTGWVALGEPDALDRILRRAFTDARNCSSDPLCAEHAPSPGDDFLHAAVCHICGFVSETTCERGNRFLDRRFLVPIGSPHLALVPAERWP
jgi:hypothetical protein